MRCHRLIVGVLVALAAPVALADGLVLFCFNWDCKTPGVAYFPEPWLKKTLAPLQQAQSPDAERLAVAEAVSQFYAKAGEQLPITADEPGNEEDETVHGRMDCIDHSSTTRNILSFLAYRKALRWHTVGPYAHRTLFLDSHYSATLVETDGVANDDRHVYTVDPWFVARGDLPAIQPVREWATYRFYSLQAEHHTASTQPVLRR